MNVQGIKAYTGNNVNISEQSNQNAQSNTTSLPVSNNGTLNQIDANYQNTDKIITRNERDFFIKMFPSSSEQLENHVLFNRSGRIQSYNLSKGSIVDGRV